MYLKTGLLLLQMLFNNSIRRLAVDLLSHEQMEIMHNAIPKIAHDDFHNQAEKLSYYYQIEMTYTRTEDDIVLRLHVPCIKTTSFLQIQDLQISALPYPI
jgi:hypothetical protein